MSDYISKLKGRYIEIYLDIIDTTDSFETALVVHEYVNSPNNLIENLGQKTRKISINCTFQANPAITKGWNESTIYPTYEAHINFLEKINFDKEVFTLTHPKYGEINGYIENISVFHDSESIDYVEVSFDFLREIIDYTPKFVTYIVPQVAAGFRGTSDKMGDFIDKDKKDSIDDVTWTAQATAFRATLNTKMTTIENNTQSIIYTIDYGTDVPGLMFQDVNEAIDRIVQFYVTSRSAPASFINNLIFGVRQLKAIFTGTEAQIVHVMGASIVAYECGVVYSEDEDNRRSIDNKSNQETFDIAGNFNQGEDIEETLTINELEDTLYEVRKFLDEAIQLDRDNRGLQDQGRYLQEYVNQIKLNRERIVTVKASEQSLHSLLLTYGLSYQLADRILKMNPSVVNPNFTNGNIDIIIPAGVSL